ncbi:hypothetical protein QUF64_10570 [Anaerolineales bacterium HSG6]|nr:hypothetical protein [Anaerolineales bacterium HSG6]MDM8529727.1 hypothetical protein [Anaerolineales bacterium HSG25]
MVKFDYFSADATFDLPWKTFVRGNASLDVVDSCLRFNNHHPSSSQYSNAQLDDYQTFQRADFLWSPPLRLTVQARFSHSTDELHGTAGFGFWNDPFMMTDWRRPAPPRVIWFFYSSSPSNMKLDRNVSGYGWKVGTLDALRWPFFALLPTAPLAIPLMNLSPLYRLCWPIAQRAINVNERVIPVEMTTWHTYSLEWGIKTARFWVDEQLILACNTPPRGPLGLVIWFDNQYMVVTPWGRFGWGLLDSPSEQWMEIRQLLIEP